MDNYKEFFDELMGFYAYDEGATDSGIHNPIRRKEMAAQLATLPEQELRMDLSRYVRDEMLDNTSLEEGYGWEDVWSFLGWIGNGEYRNVS